MRSVGQTATARLLASLVMLASSIGGPVSASEGAASNGAASKGAASEEDGSEVVIESIAHASFRVTSPTGVRVILDPFNDHIWLGYRFPADLEADLVLVSHPHFDHDASYAIVGDPPVLRRPGTAQLGDVRVRGLEGRHAEPYGEEFGRLNTVWTIETGGLVLVHWGDNEPLSDQLAEEIGRVDVLFLPIDGDQHILANAAVEAILERLEPRILIPMHYRIPELSEPKSLGPIDPWLIGRERARQTETTRLELQAETLPQATEIVVMPPAAEVRPWSDRFRESLRLRQVAADSEDPDERLSLLQRAVESYTGNIRLWRELAVELHRHGRGGQAMRVLERGIASVPRDDWKQLAEARNTLGSLYQQQKRSILAAGQYRWVLDHSANLELLTQAREGLEELAAERDQEP